MADLRPPDPPENTAPSKTLISSKRPRRPTKTLIPSSSPRRPKPRLSARPARPARPIWTAFGEYVEDSESPSDIRVRVRVSNVEEPGKVGVRDFLEGLGLVQYALVFEIHEVDDEVLPMLTLEDLRDMGINAVGSRRKIYCAISKLDRSGDS